MAIPEFRFEEFELMEYSLQLSLHTVALKDGFFNKYFTTTITTVTWMGGYDGQNAD